MISNEFMFLPPPGWSPVPNAQPLAFTDARGSMLTVWSSHLTAREPAGELETAISDSQSILRRAASDRGVEQVSELHESRHPHLRCWTGEARARDGSLILSQCLLASQRGVFLATLQTPPPEQAHRELLQSFVRSVFSSDLRAIVRRARRTPPGCVAEAAPAIEEDEADPSDNEPFGTSFKLGCGCGCRKTAVLGDPTQVESEILMLGPLALECSACGRVTEIFDPDRHGYDAEVCGDGRGPEGSGRRQRYPCGGCSQTIGEATASFAFNDPEGLQTLPEQMAGREQDAFDWFTLEWRCAGCGQTQCIADHELA
jgi:hypothetical protein